MKKNKLDAVKAKTNARFGVRIFMAAKQGIDPAVNIYLQRALKDAHAANLPKENIERALKKAADNSNETFTSGLYEVFGHGGVGLIVQTLTNSSNRTNMAIKATARKLEVKMASAGSVVFLFSHLGVFQPTAEYDKDAVLDAVLEADIEEFDFTPYVSVDSDSDDDVASPDSIVTSPVHITLLQDTLRGMGIDGTASLTYVPQDSVVVNEEHYQLNSQLIDAFEDLEDVDAIFHNMDLGNTLE